MHTNRQDLKLTTVAYQDGGSPGPLLVELYSTWYTYSDQGESFSVVSRMPASLPLQLGRALKALEAIGQGNAFYFEGSSVPCPFAHCTQTSLLALSLPLAIKFKSQYPGELVMLGHACRDQVHCCCSRLCAPRHRVGQGLHTRVCHTDHMVCLYCNTRALAACAHS